MPNIQINSETIIGITLIALGTFTFAKGASQYITQDNCMKSVRQISKLADTVNEANGMRHIITKP